MQSLNTLHRDYVLGMNEAAFIQLSADTVAKNVQVVIGQLFKSFKSTEPLLLEDGKKLIELRDRFAKQKDVALAAVNVQFEELSKIVSPIKLEAETKEMLARPARSNPLDMEQVKLWLAAHDSTCGPAVEALIKGVRHISQAEFEKSFQFTLEDFNKRFGEKGFEYCVLGQKNKSNGWMTDLARSKLTIKPKVEGSLIYPLLMKPLMKQYLTVGKAEFPQNIVLFDDCIYSGEQMTRIVRSIFSEVQAANQTISQENQRRLVSKTAIENTGLETEVVQNQLAPIPVPKVIIACPFMTAYGKNELNKLNISQSIMQGQIMILHHETIPVVRDVVSADVLKTLRAMYPVKSSSRDKETLLSPYKQDIANRGVVYFDHKVPDKLSFPEAVAQGFVGFQNGMAFTKMSFLLIPKTIPPYQYKTQTKA